MRTSVMQNRELGTTEFFPDKADGRALTRLSVKQCLIPGILILTLVMAGAALADARDGRIVRMVKLDIDPVQVDTYKSALKEQIEAAVRVEPGVLALYAVSETANPAHVMIFEIYTDSNAYQAHLESPHYKKYKTATQSMVRSRELIEVNPILLGAKGTANGN